jgi:hypothetical protein
MEKKQPPVLTYLDGQALVDVANGKWEKVDGTIRKKDTPPFWQTAIMIIPPPPFPWM